MAAMRRSELVLVAAVGLAVVVGQPGDARGAAGPFQTARARILTETRAVNDEHLAGVGAPRDVRARSGVVYRRYGSHGYQFQPLASFGRVNALTNAGERRKATALARALVARGRKSGSSICWEYSFGIYGRAPALDLGADTGGRCAGARSRRSAERRAPRVRGDWAEAAHRSSGGAVGPALQLQQQRRPQRAAPSAALVAPVRGPHARSPRTEADPRARRLVAATPPALRHGLVVAVRALGRQCAHRLPPVRDVAPLEARPYVRQQRMGAAGGAVPRRLAAAAAACHPATTTSALRPVLGRARTAQSRLLGVEAGCSDGSRRRSVGDGLAARRPARSALAPRRAHALDGRRVGFCRRLRGERVERLDADDPGSSRHDAARRGGTTSRPRALLAGARSPVAPAARPAARPRQEGVTGHAGIGRAVRSAPSSACMARRRRQLRQYSTGQALALAGRPPPRPVALPALRPPPHEALIWVQ